MVGLAEDEGCVVKDEQGPRAFRISDNPQAAGFGTAVNANFKCTE